MKIKTILLLILVQITSVHISAQEFLSTNGKAIVNESGDTILLRGMGLGGWMLQEGYMMQTSSFANAQYQLREKIEELIGEFASIKVFPNPSDGILFVEGQLDNQVSGDIQIFNLLGQKVVEKKINSAGLFRETLILQHLSSGSYLVVVRGGDGSILTRKQVIIGD